MHKNISLSRENINYLRYAFAHFFPEDTIYSADKPFVSGEFNWKNRGDFIDFVYRLTGIKIKNEKDFINIKKAQLEIENLVSRPTPEKATESNLPDKEARELQEIERQKREAVLKEAQENAQRNTDNAIKRQQELFEQLKNRKIYVKVEDTENPQVSDEQLKQIDTLKEAAKADPKRLVDQITEVVESKISSSGPQDTTREEIHILAKEAAYETVKNLQGVSLAEEVIISGALATNEDLVAETIPDIGIRQNFVNTALENSGQILARYSFNRELIASTFGENFTRVVFGPENIEKLQVTISHEPQADFRDYDLSQAPQTNLSLLDNQNYLIGQVKEFGIDKIKTKVLQKASVRLDGLISKLPADSFLAKTYSSSAVQGALSYFGTGTPAVAWEGTTFFGRIAVQNGFGPILNFIGGKTGINFGIKKIVSAAGKEVGKKAVTSTAGKLAGSFAGKAAGAAAGGAAGAGTGAAAGSVVPGIGTAIGAVAGFIASKIDWSKVKKAAPYIVGGVLGIGAFAIAGPTIGIIVGVTALGATSLAAGGTAGLSAAVSGVGSFFGAIGSAIGVAIGTPILIIFLVIPILVALILFIINSGAYVVPVSESTFGRTSNPYIDVIKTPEPPGPFTNKELPKTITYKITIKAKRSVLTNVSIKYDCKVISAANKNCPQTSDVPTEVDSISPSLPYTFTYTSTYDNNYINSAIIDTVTVTADTSEETGTTTETSASVTFGTPPISCPVPAAIPLNQNNFSYNSVTDMGHGSTSYWRMMGGTPYRYALPQWTGCNAPADCSYYGYAYDVFPSGINTVYAPTILGKEVSWSLSGTGFNGAAGFTLIYKDSASLYSLVLTHVSSTIAPKTVSSGQKITTLFNQGSNTHLHIEFQMNGRWVKPENYFCK